MKPWLCAAGVELRDAVTTWYPDRRTTSDGWIGDARHSARKSAISVYLDDQIRICAKTDKRISYVSHNGMIASRILNFKWRKYSGFNKHTKHVHVSFTKLGDKDGKAFDIPLLGGKI